VLEVKNGELLSYGENIEMKWANPNLIAKGAAIFG